MPVLKENIKQSTLNFWSATIFPLAIYCQKKSIQLAEVNDGIGAHSCELLYLQLWNLLPSFCNAPTDIKSSFKVRKLYRLSQLTCSPLRCIGQIKNR